MVFAFIYYKIENKQIIHAHIETLIDKKCTHIFILVDLNTQSKEQKKYECVILLKNDYGYSLTKSQLAEILDKSEQTIDRRIKESINIPNYIKSGKGEKSSYIFPVIEVAEYLIKNGVNFKDVGNL